MALCTATEVKKLLSTRTGRSLPAECTDAEIDDTITRKGSVVLGAFGHDAEGDLVAPQTTVAKDACMQLSAAELLRAFFPLSETTGALAKSYEDAAYRSIDRCIQGRSGASPSPRYLGSEVM